MRDEVPRTRHEEIGRVRGKNTKNVEVSAWRRKNGRPKLRWLECIRGGDLRLTGPWEMKFRTVAEGEDE